MRPILLPMLAICAVALWACDDPRARQPQVQPDPGSADLAPSEVQSADGAVERPGPYAWDDASGAFTFEGEPLRSGRLWTFAGSTEGFLMAGGEVVPAESSGLRLATQAYDSVLRTPSDLAIEGARYNHVLVRVTRLAAGSEWDGALHYVTDSHPESASFTTTPIQGGEPNVNETVIMVYDMRSPAAGGQDWVTSTIEQIRLDFDDAAGGKFLVHQIAVTEPPSGSAAPSPRPAA